MTRGLIPGWVALPVPHLLGQLKALWSCCLAPDTYIANNHWYVQWGFTRVPHAVQISGPVTGRPQSQHASPSNTLWCTKILSPHKKSLRSLSTAGWVLQSLCHVACGHQAEGRKKNFGDVTQKRAILRNPRNPILTGPTQQRGLQQGQWLEAEPTSPVVPPDTCFSWSWK